MNANSPMPVDVNMKLEDQWCALHFACMECHFEAARILLEEGANPNVTNMFGRTALHIASIKGYIVELLNIFSSYF